MLVILTSSGDVTATYLGEKLAESGVPFVRLDTDTCADQVRVRYTVAEGPTLEISDRALRPADVTAVWFRRPSEIAVSIEGDATERAHVANEWAEAIEGFFAHVPVERWVNHPTCNVRASHKMEQLTRAAQTGLRVPKTLVTQSQESIRIFWRANNERMIVKPLSSGYLERKDGTVTSIYTNRVLREHIEVEPLAASPTFVQEQIAKDYDVRVTMIDDSLTAVALRHSLDGAQIVDIRRDNMDMVEYATCEMPTSVESALREMVKSYGLRVAAIDFGVTLAGDWVFFEINPNGQWAWMDIAGVTALWQDFVHAFSA